MKLCLLVLLTIWKVPTLDAEFTNGVQGAAVSWVRSTSLDVINNLLLRTWPKSLLDKDHPPKWRATTVTDTDNVVRTDRRQRLVRWDKRPPNDILSDGFYPIVTDSNPASSQTDLFNFAKSNVQSFFVSTTKTQRGKRKYVWTPRSSNKGYVYQYEIYAPGGLDVNESLLDLSPWPNQMEVAFPGGIQEKYIRSVRELLNGRIQRVWSNPNFIDPEKLERIACANTTPQFVWRPNHPDGGHRDRRSKRSADDLMYGGDGSLLEDVCN